MINETIEAIHTLACEPVHPAWVDRFTTPIVVSMAVLQFSSGKMVRLAPFEAGLNPEKYPALGLKSDECDSSSLSWRAPSGETRPMKSLAVAAPLLPFTVISAEESDPLEEGAVSEIVFVSAAGARIVFRHIMPPMTLGIDLVAPLQAPNKQNQADA